MPNFIKTLLPINDCNGQNGVSVRSGMQIRSGDLQAIVIHNTFSPNKQTPRDIANYWTRKGHSGASAHCIIQDGKIFECIPFYPRQKLEIAHHCGDNWRCLESHKRNFFDLKFKPKSNNLNNYSIGIEIFSINENMDKKDIETAANLTAFLLNEYNFTEEETFTRVVRHYDVTSKECPMAFVKDAKLWVDFLKLVNDLRTQSFFF